MVALHSRMIRFLKIIPIDSIVPIDSIDSIVPIENQCHVSAFHSKQLCVDNT